MVLLGDKCKTARVADLKKSPTPPGRVQSFCTEVHTVAQSANRSAHTPGGAGVMGVVGMLIGPAGLTGGEAATGRRREGLVVLAGTAGGVVVGLTPTGTAGVAPGVAGLVDPVVIGPGAELAGVAAGVAGLPGALGEAGLPGAFGAAGLPGTLGEAGLPGAFGEAGLLGAFGVAGLPGAPGEAGLPGALGEAGLPGAFGVAGLLGAAGVAGLLVALGEAGLPGAFGVAGLPGAFGEAGLPGAAGVAGLPGAGETLPGLLLGLGPVPG